VVKQNRFNPPVVLVKKLLDENRLGRIHAFQVNCFWNRSRAYYNSPWKGKKDKDGGILFTQFSHFADLLIWFLGEAVSVKSMKSNFIMKDVLEMEDTGFALLRMKHGAIGSFNYTITSFEKNMEGSITLFGEKGTVKIGGQYLNTLEYFNVEGETLPRMDHARHANDYGFYLGSMSNHDIMYENVLNALNNTSHSIVEGSEALKCIHLIEQINGASNG
jgi:predicted dehydrogenase